MPPEGEAQTFDSPEAAVEAGLFADLEEDEKETDDSESGDDREEDVTDDDGAQEEDADEDVEDDDGDSEGEDETEVQTLEDLAEAAELDAKDLDGLEVKLTVDGEETAMTIADLKDMAKTNRQEQWTGAFQQLAEQRRETVKQAKELAEQQKQAAGVNAKLLEEIERTLMGDVDELRKLAAENSPLYGRKHQEFERKSARLAEIKRVVGLQADDAKNRDSESSETARRNETELLFLHHPELRSDADAANKAMLGVGKVMFKLGWSEDEIRNAAMDHRLIRLALMASQSEVPEKKALTKVRNKFKRPKGKKAIKSRRTAVRSEASRKRSAKALDRLSKSGSEDAFVESLELDGLV